MPFIIKAFYLKCNKFNDLLLFKRSGTSIAHGINQRHLAKVAEVCSNTTYECSSFLPSTFAIKEAPMNEFETMPQGKEASEEEKAHAHSTLVSRNVVVSGRRTSIRLEPEMWDGLKEICQRERSSIHQVCTSASLQKKENTSLTAAIRVFVMRYFRDASTEEGHAKAGHGYGLTLGLCLEGGAEYVSPPTSRLTKTSFA